MAQKKNQVMFMTWYRNVGEAARAQFPMEALEEVKAAAFECIAEPVAAVTRAVDADGDAATAQ